MAMKMRDHFTDYSANAIVTSWLDYPEADLMENEVKNMNIVPASYAFVEDLRMKSGMAVAYAAFIWPKVMFSDMLEYIQAMP